MTKASFYWHDYETFGVDPQCDRAVQFAGLRTDFEFNPIEAPLVLYCTPADDMLPQPEACCVTGITPQKAAEKGVCEAEFIAQIHQQMARANTCSIGYNNLRFDDEVTRNLLYRNFYDPYAREWQKGNSRWDLIDLVRTMQALRPEGINWPTDSEGRLSFRLELLTAANHIEHIGAHDALSDVYATIALAQLVKKAQPRLFDFFLKNRGKHQVKALLQLGSYTPVIHVSGMYGLEKQYLALVLPICEDPSHSNGVIVYDLSINPELMLNLSVEEIQARLFTAKEDLPTGIDRIPLKTIHINKCPIVAPEKVLRTEDAERLAIDRQQCHQYAKIIQQSDDLLEKLQKVFAPKHYEPITDPDLMIYSGGFFSARDKQAMSVIREQTPEQLADYTWHAEDSRLKEMLFRYRARNYPQSLNTEEQKQWKIFCLKRLSGKKGSRVLGFTEFREKLKQLQQKNVDFELLQELEQYALNLENKLLIK